MKGTQFPAQSLVPSGAASVVAVVLNWSAEEFTSECIDSLECSQYSRLRILLIDNDSPDGSGERLHARFPTIPYLQMSRNLGYGVANNRGIEWALAHRADYVLVVNNDAVVLPEAIGLLVEAAESREEVAIVAPFIGYHDDPETAWYAGGQFSRLRGLGVHRAPRPAEGLTKAEEVSFASGCVCLISARAIRDVGTFAEDFFSYVEDAEFCVRLRRAGYRILFEPRARALHRTPRLEHDPAPYKIRLRDRNRRRVMRRHFGPLVRIPFLARFYVTRLILLLRYSARLDWPRATAVVQGMVER